jgi:hemerythrin
MAYIDFTDQYSVGVGTIDQQHSKLFDLINAFFNAVKAGKGNDAVAPTLNELVKYTQYHFANEERFLQQTRYARYPEHKQKHDALLASVLEFKAKFENGIAGQAVLLLEFLKKWLTSHILVVDKDYASTLIENGIR